MEFVLIFIALGLITGIFSGLLGIGGGVITVPALYYILLWTGFPFDQLMQTAICTSLAATFITSAGASLAHHRKRAIWPRAVAFLAPGLILGCVSGVQLARFLPSATLRLIFGCMAILIGLYFCIPKLPLPNFGHRPNPLLIFLGLLIGHLSSLLGVGGGIFTMPILLSYHAPLPNAVATSAASTLLTALVGSIAYLILFKDLTPLPGSFGFIHLSAFFAISAGSLCTTQLGARLVHTLPTRLIKQLFGCAVTLTGLIMLT
jgi:uncharacterized membrane protein YfcA